MNYVEVHASSDYRRSVRKNRDTEEDEPSSESPSGGRRMARRVGTFRRGRLERRQPENVRRQRRRLRASTRLRRSGRGLGVSGVARQRPGTQGALHAAAQGRHSAAALMA